MSSAPQMVELADVAGRFINLVKYGRKRTAFVLSSSPYLRDSLSAADLRAVPDRFTLSLVLDADPRARGILESSIPTDSQLVTVADVQALELATDAEVSEWLKVNNGFVEWSTSAYGIAGLRVSPSRKTNQVVDTTLAVVAGIGIVAAFHSLWAGLFTVAYIALSYVCDSSIAAVRDDLLRNEYGADRWSKAAEAQRTLNEGAS